MTAVSWQLLFGELTAVIVSIETVPLLRTILLYRFMTGNCVFIVEEPVVLETVHPELIFLKAGSHTLSKLTIRS